MSLLSNELYRFGEFTLDRGQRVLLRAGKPLALTPKVFDTLLLLVENSGRIVEKGELMRRLWPDTFVEEANLTFNVQQVRKLLGDNARQPVYVETIPRRGYRFISEVERVLSDAGGTGVPSTPGLETSEISSPAGAGLQSPPAARPSQTAIAHTVERRPGSEKNGPYLFAIPRAALKAVSASVALVVLAGLALTFWTHTGGSKDKAGEEVERTGAAASPLAVEKLTSTGQSKHAAISPDGKYLAYARGVGRDYGVWLVHLATNANVEIVPARGPVFGLAFAHGGDHLYFVRGAPSALYRVSLLGGAPTKILDHLEGKFSISPDDRHVAFIRHAVRGDGQREYSLMTASAAGGGERALLVMTQQSKLDAPAWSPGGDSIICTRGDRDSGGQDVGLIEVNAGDGSWGELPLEKFSQIHRVAWLPQKRGLLMSAVKRPNDYGQLWHVSYPGMELKQLTEGLVSFADLSVTADAGKAAVSQVSRLSYLWAGPGRGPQDFKKITHAMDAISWTPDGEIVYSTVVNHNQDLWVSKPDGMGQRQLTAHAGANGTPAVTPDGRHIVFISNRTGSFQVWRMDADGGNQTRLTGGGAKNFPATSPDGRWVYYNSVADWHLWKVPAEGGDPVRLTDYIAAHPAAAPDGRTVACVGADRSRTQILLVPSEGGAPLKRFDVDGRTSRLQWTSDGRSLIYASESGGVTTLFERSGAGGPPEKIAVFDEDVLFDFGLSQDGRWLAVTRGGWEHDIVLISNPARS